MPRLLLHTCSVVITLLCTQCGSGKKKEDSSSRFGGSAAMARMVNVKQDMVSRWDKEFNTSGAGDNGAMRSLQRRSFSGDKSFSGLKEYQTKDFAQSGMASQMGKKDARWGSQQSHMDREYSTKENSWGRQAAPQAKQMFRDGEAVFETNEVRDASRSLKQNSRPTRISGDKSGPTQKDAYSEDQVKRLLGR